MKVIIVGGGQAGAYIADLLLKNSCSVKLIENRDSVVSKLKKDLPPDCILYGSGTEPTTLENAGIAEADVLIAVTGEDEANLVASTIAKFEFDVPRVIARVNNPKNTWLFNSSMGVDVGINQADLMAHIVVEEVDFTNMLTLMKLNHGTYSIVEVKVGPHSDSVSKAVRDIPIPRTAVLIAVYREKKVIIPHGDTVIEGNDTILAFADNEAQAKINKLFG